MGNRAWPLGIVIWSVSDPSIGKRWKIATSGCMCVKVRQLLSTIVLLNMQGHTLTRGSATYGIDVWTTVIIEMAREVTVAVQIANVAVTGCKVTAATEASILTRSRRMNCKTRLRIHIKLSITKATAVLPYLYWVY